MTAQTASTFREAGGSGVANSIYTSQLNQQIFDCDKIKKSINTKKKRFMTSSTRLGIRGAAYRLTKG